MKIALFGNLEKEENHHVATSILEFLETEGISCSLNTAPSSDTTVLVSLGGDGTILRLMHQYPECDLPILGINMGHLGFMADIPQTDWKQSLIELIEGKYSIEERIVLDGVTPTKTTCFAVNDMVVHRGKNPSLIDLAIHVDDRYLNTFSADGIIVATPSGSTAYSLSSGGPILTPDLQAFVIIPICPHTISNRPIVLFPRKEIVITTLKAKEATEIIADGFTKGELCEGEILTLKKSHKSFKMINLHNHTDYFATLRTKLEWSGQVRLKK